ncbi:Smr/MutS family protein [Acidocella sp.]|uniref:Smr/MutS family protein n=1 Tax=Acidocella sp. TaxID=50710 RepID=UPI002636EF48|nr:Smr/MutS family protein [Acidocella sp.]
MTRKTGLSEEELELWAAYGRTLHRVFPGKAPPPPPPPASLSAPPAPLTRESKVAPMATPAGWLGVNFAPPGLDKSTWAKFRTQRMRAEARLDLHGHTAAQAHAEVLRFLDVAYASGLRCVEIITGNGDILARELPHWLNHPQLRPFILGLAHPHARNNGAVRVLLRRRRH